jgi:hypothetical protein
MSSDQAQRQMLDETAEDKAEAIHGAHQHNRSVRLTVGKWRLLFNTEHTGSPTLADPAPAFDLLACTWAALGSFGWLLTALICLTLGYMFVWQRGFYMDDYATRLMAIDVLTGQWRPIWSLSRIPTFPIRILSCMIVTSFTGLLPTHEFFVRAISALGIGVNAVLLGWLIYRILGSRLAAVSSGWLFLMPIYAQEAVLWVGAVPYVFAAGFALLFLHVSWSALTRPQRAGRWITLGTLACATTLLIVEQFIFAAGLVLIFGITIAAQRQTASYWALLKRSLCVLIWPLAVAAIFYVLLYGNSWVVDAKGGLDLSLAGIVERSLGYFKRLAWMTMFDWGRRLTGDAFGIGIAVLLRSWKGMALSFAASVSLLLTVLAWRTGEREYLPRYCVGLMVFCAGVTWFVVSLLVPSVLVKGQILEYRLLYFPTAGAGLAVGALAWMAAKRLRCLGCDKLFVAIAGVLLLLSTVCMLGYAQAFAVRYKLDRRQIAALVHALPAQDLPENSYVVPFNNEERLFGKDDRISLLLVGVFETPWSARAALEEAYRRNDLQVITPNRWWPIQFSYMGDQEPPSNQLGIQGVSVPVDRTVLFSYRAGSAFLIESLTITKSDGSQHTVQFPIARDLRRHGVPTISIVVPN